MTQVRRLWPLLTGDAADLTEHLENEIAPGLCWREHEDLALESICKLKRVAREERAELWPNHDLLFWRERMSAAAFHE